MTAQETERIEPRGGHSAGGVTTALPVSTRSASAGKAYERRTRRTQSVAERRLTATGSPITSALTRVPFVALIILLLAGGVVGVLYLNTISDAAGLKASDSRRAQMDLNTQIEAANKNIADQKNPAKLAAEAKALGLVPAGDAAIINIGADGKVSIVGTPTAVPTPAPPVIAAPITTAPAAAAPAAPVVAPPVTAATTVPAAITTQAARALKTTPAKATPAAKATPVKTPAAKATPVKTPAAKATPARAGQQAPATTGAGR